MFLPLASFLGITLIIPSLSHSLDKTIKCFLVTTPCYDLILSLAFAQRFFDVNQAFANRPERYVMSYVRLIEVVFPLGFTAMS